MLEREENSPQHGEAESSPAPGLPGYRTRPGRSGWDYLDSQRELAYMEGLFIRHLFTGHVRTRNPFALVALVAIALCFFVLAIAFAQKYRFALIPLFTCAVPFAILGFVFLANVVLSLVMPKPPAQD